jgi:hypothetical protein
MALNVEKGSAIIHYLNMMGRIVVDCLLKINLATLDRVLSMVDLVTGKSGEIVRPHVEVE